MTFLNRSSIRARLKAVILLISFVSILFVFAGLFVYEHVTYNDTLVNDIVSKADILADNSTAALFFNDSTDASRLLASLASQPHITVGAIYDITGRLFAFYSREGSGGSVPKKPATEGWEFTDDALVTSRPVSFKGKQIGTIYVAMDLLGRQEHFQSYVQIAFLVLLGSLVASFFIGGKLERTISGPILGLAGTAKRVSETQDYSIRASKNSEDETGFLADAVNQMMQHIQTRDNDLRQTNEAMTQEIAERRRIEQALRTAETQLRVITETTPMLLTRCNSEREYIYVNRAVAQIVNLPPEQILGRSVREVMGEEAYKALCPYIDRVLQGTPVEFETRIVFPAGPRTFRVVYTPDRNELNDVVGWFGSISDITESKLAEQALRASEERFRQFMSNLPGAAWIKDLQGRYVYANEEGCRIFGHAPPELYGKTDEEIFPAATADQFKENDQKAIAGNAGVQTTETMLQGDGIHYSIVTKFPVLGSEGKPVSIGGIAIDITERKKAEEALRESEDRARLTQTKLAAIVESSHDAIISKDRNGIIMSWNAGAKHIFGYDAEEIIGRSITCLIPADRLHEEKEITEKLWNDRAVEHFSTIRVTKDGRPVYVSLTESPIKDTSGNIIGASKIARDITEQRRAEEELRLAHDELEARVKERTAALVTLNAELQKKDLQLSTAQQIAHLGSWEWDIATSKVTWSDELYRIYGLQPGEFGGNLESFLDLLHPEDRSNTLGYIQQALQTQAPFAFEERILRPDGSMRILHSQGRVITHAGGKVARVLGVCLDITDRKRADQKFRGLLESAPDAMVIMDGNEKIILVNEQTERLFGYSRTELLGQPAELLLPKGFGRNGTNGRHAPSIGESLELNGRRKDTTEFPVEITMSPLTTEEGPVFSTAIRDITEQKRLRALLVEAEQKRSADLRRYVRSVQRAQEDERQRIARELHDDLCQRLTGMKLNVEVVADEFRVKDRSLYRKLFSFNKQCERAITEVRRMSVNLRPPVLDDFGLVTALGLLTREFEKLYKIPVKMDMDSSVRLQLDPQLEIALYRIAQEALTNVAKYAHASGVVLLARKSETAVVLSIRDNGKGFNPADTTRRRDPHTGFGLISMRERSELLGGSFSINSSPSEGTVVTVTIPLNIGVRNEEDALAYS